MPAMTERFSVGIDVANGSATALIVNVRNGRVAANETSTTPGRAFEAAIDRAAIQKNLLIGVGVCGATVEQEFEVPTTVVHSRAHACVPGAGVASPSTMVLVFDGDSCQLLMNSRVESQVTGVRVEADSILPGYFGYELSPVLVVGNERLAVDVRRACESLRAAGVPVRRFVAAGASPRKSPELLQLLANMLDARIKLPASEYPEALGAAVLVAIAARTHPNLSQTVHAMAHLRRDLIYRPDVRMRKHYDQLFADRS
jgi:ribulose kinase